MNTAVAARVGAHRVTYQPNINGIPDPSGLQLRVDGGLMALGTTGLDLGSGGRIVKTAAHGGIEIDWPNGTVLDVTPSWWASQNKWYLNVDVLRTPSLEGIMGAILPASWLPALPDGASAGPMPATMPQRYATLYQKFGDVWRVNNYTSLFDYAPGTSTETFTLKSWPPQNQACVIPQSRPARPASPQVAETVCRGVTAKSAHADCIFDVTATGHEGFAKTYQLSQQIKAASTTITVTDNADPTQVGESVAFTAIVEPSTATSKGVPAGTVRFMVDDAKVGDPVRLDSAGHASWDTSRLRVGTHEVAASYIPSEKSAFLGSRSSTKSHTVRSCGCESASKVKRKAADPLRTAPGPPLHPRRPVMPFHLPSQAGGQCVRQGVERSGGIGAQT